MRWNKLLSQADFVLASFRPDEISSVTLQALYLITYYDFFNSWLEYRKTSILCTELMCLKCGVPVPTAG